MVFDPLAEELSEFVLLLDCDELAENDKLLDPVRLWLSEMDIVTVAEAEISVDNVFFVMLIVLEALALAERASVLENDCVALQVFDKLDEIEFDSLSLLD